MQGWVFSLCFFHHHLVFPWQPPTHLPCGSGCSSALLLLVPSPLGLRYPSVPSLAPLFSPVSWPLALLTLPLSRWLKVLGWVQIPSHFHPFPLIFSPSESFSFLPEKKFPWLSWNPTSCSQSQAPFLSQSQGFLLLIIPLLSGAVLFQTFGWYLAPPVWVEMQGFYFPEERKLDWLQLELACWDGTFPALLWELCDITQTSFTGSI